MFLSTGVGRNDNLNTAFLLTSSGCVDIKRLFIKLKLFLRLE